MKQLLTKLSLFFFLISLIGVSLNFVWPVDHHWGNKEYSWKIKEYKKNKYNTVLFGSSRIYRGINPLLLDSLINQNNTPVFKSFNLATHGSWFNETFYLYDQFLTDTILSSGVQTVFMEFQNVMSIRPDKLTSEKVIYYQNLDHYWFILKYSFQEVFRDPGKILTSSYSMGVYSVTTFINLTNLKRISSKIFSKEPSAAKNTNARGFLEYEELLKQNKEISSEVIKSFTDNIEMHLSLKEVEYNPVYYGKVIQLINESKKRGIELIFVLPPVRLTEGMMAVFNAIPIENKKEICDPQKYPELYNPANWIDNVHLNKNGSLILTTLLASEYSGVPR